MTENNVENIGTRPRNKFPISEGTACIIVRDKSLLANPEASFYLWLRKEGFSSWGHSYYNFVDWVYVNIHSMTYAIGMPGIRITTPVYEHAIRPAEFKTIYNIFMKYKGKSILQME